MRTLAFLLGLLLCWPAYAQQVPNPQPRIHVAHNAALSAAATTAYPEGVYRNDFAANFGAPPLFFRGSNAACPIPGGNGGSQVPSADGKCWIAVHPAGDMDIRQFGADPSGSADSAPAIQLAANVATSSKNCVYIPPGTYKLNSRITVDMPATGGFCFKGDGGHQRATLNWPNANGGLKITAYSQPGSVYIADLSFTTSQAGGGTGIEIVNAGAFGGSMGNHNILKNLWFAGDDRIALYEANLHYWTDAIITTGISVVDISDTDISGAGFNLGRGIKFEGIPSTTVYGIVLNMVNMGFFDLDIGFTYGRHVQGVTIVNANFTGGNIAVYNVDVFPETTAGDLLSISNSQFNTADHGIKLLGEIVHVLISNCLFYPAVNKAGIYLAFAQIIDISNNTFISATYPPINSVGIIADKSIVENASTIVGNSFVRLTSAVVLGVDTFNWVVGRNAFKSIDTNPPVINNAGIKNDVELNTTWTPSLKFGDTSVGMAFTNYGNFNVTNKVASFDLRITLTAKGSSVGEATIIGLPYSSLLTLAQGTVKCGYYNYMAGMPGALSGVVVLDSGKITLVVPTITGVSAITDANFTDTSELNCSGSYRLP
jgi:hypothetical protein